MPNFVVTFGAALMGAIPGIISRFIVKKRTVRQVVLSTVLSHIIGSLTVKTIGLISVFGWGVLVRIPVYVFICAVECAILILLFRKSAFRGLVDKIDGGKNDL